MANKKDSAAEKLATAQDDIKRAILDVLLRHGIEYASVNANDLRGGEFAFNVTVHDLHQLDPRSVESARIPEGVK